MIPLYDALHPEPESRFRNELKYLCSEGELQILQARIRPLCPPDRHAGPQGTYDIRSIYFDTFDDRCFWENENGTDPREKFRIRIYNGSDARITLECKRKERTMTQKTSCRLSKEEFQQILSGQLLPKAAEDPLLRRFLLQQELRPKVIVSYQRTPFVYAPGNVRITLDRNIGSSQDFSRFFDTRLPVRPILPKGQHILEVKYDEFLPDFLYQAMSLGTLRQTTFSKYYLCRKFSMGGMQYERTRHHQKILSRSV